MTSQNRQNLLKPINRKNSIPQASREEPIGLSFSQQRLWFLDQLEGGKSATYNVPFALRIQGPFNVYVLQRSLNEIRRRHESLRTRFEFRDSEAVQIIDDPSPFPFRDVDLSNHPDFESALEKALTEIGHEPFDLAKGPLVRSVLFRLSPQEHVLIVVVHHIVTDGWSMGVFERELGTLYDAFLEGKTSPLPELQIQFADYAAWQRRLLKGDKMEKGLAYWKKHLSGAPAVLDLPADRPRPVAQSFEGARFDFELDKDLTTRVNQLGRDRGATLFMTLMAAFRVLLLRYTGQEDTVIGTPVANRSHVETESLIGFFVNTLVLRGNLAGNPSFDDALSREREIVLNSYDLQDIPFEKLVAEIGIEPDLSRNPLFQVLFAMQNAPRSPISLTGTKTRFERVRMSVAKIDLALSVRETPNGLNGRVEYSKDLFDESTIERMMNHYREILKQVVMNPRVDVAYLSILTEPERHQLLVEWNDTKTEYPRESCIHEVFETNVEKTPSSIALTVGNDNLTFDELNRRANRLARHLVELGVCNDSLVGLCMERSLDVIVAMLAILKAGGAYVPLDPDYPSKRLAYMLEDSGVALVLSQAHLHDQVPRGSWTLLDSDAFVDSDGQYSDENLPSRSTAKSLAYMIYTSGSTGLPKGCLIEHRGIVRLVKESTISNFQTDDSILLVAPLSFDASMLQIWGAMLNGARLVVPPPGQLFVKDLGRFIKRSGITWLAAPTGLFQLLIDGCLDDLLGIRHLMTGGDTASPPHVRRALEHLPGIIFTNGYGPTECSVGTTGYDLLPGQEVGNNVPIGKPFSNSLVYILDKNRNLVPVGVSGELCIGGDGVGRGYHNRPELTEEKFIANPFSEAGGGRLYRSGDLCRWLPDGNIEFLGRLDTQVKIRGFRIELGEIEAIITDHARVESCVVIAQEEDPGDKRLIAYIVPATDPGPTPGEIRDHLQERLPSHMVPQAYINLESIPLTPSKKIDREQLPEPDISHFESIREKIAPRTDDEKLLAVIWEETLGLSPVGVTDSFFDLGGHSILAVELIAKVKEEFSHELSLAGFFQDPTITGQIKSLNGGVENQSWKYLVPLQTKGEKDPLFCVHNLGSSTQHYAPFARHFAGERPVYGVQGEGLDGEKISFLSVEAMASAYVSEIMALQPRGPYNLLGFCFGSRIVLEIARQIKGTGADIKFMGFVDGASPTLPRIRRSTRDKVEAHMNRLRSEGIGHVVRASRDQLELRSSRFRSRVHNILASAFLNVGVTLPKHIRFEYVKRANLDIMQTYDIKPYDGKIFVFRSTSLKKYPEDLGWRSYISGGVETFTIQGPHGLWKEPYNYDLARAVMDSINRANDIDDGIFQTVNLSVPSVAGVSVD